MKEGGKQMRTVWDIPNNKSKEELKYGTHPTQKPLRISERILLVSGVQGGKLLVPFAGSGSEMVSGYQYGMDVYGFEIDENYFHIAEQRLQDVYQQKETDLFR
jgi:site-specific DNA-methyltransferase (adenine-specific)